MFWRRLGWRVHGYGYPVVWWARRKPHSRFRQWAWDQVDELKWRRAMRYRRKLRKMTPEQFRAHIEKVSKESKWR